VPVIEFEDEQDEEFEDEQDEEFQDAPKDSENQELRQVSEAFRHHLIHGESRRATAALDGAQPPGVQ
jgi:hypothetical protein